MLTARSDTASKVRGFGLGADDYVTKPFSAEELMARIGAVLRRGPDRNALPSGPFVDGELTIDYTQHRATMSGQYVELTRQEYKLLACLAENVGRVVVHDELLRRVWGPGYEGNTEILHTTIRRLRRKLQHSGCSTSYVKTWRSIGYQLALIPPA
jgi:DNA-binding response OmpR family regulator